jgi:ABC-type antimicrobial peptide transport system permease subunit
VLGILLGHGLIQLLDPIIVAQTGVSIGAMSFAKGELYLIPTLIVLAALVGLLPSLAAYRTDVAKALSDRP